MPAVWKMLGAKCGGSAVGGHTTNDGNGSGAESYGQQTGKHDCSRAADCGESHDVDEMPDGGVASNCGETRADPRAVARSPVWRVFVGRMERSAMGLECGEQFK